MKKIAEDKELVLINEHNIFCRIRNFFRNLFKKRKNNSDNTLEDINKDNAIKEVENKTKFKEYIKNIENEETILLELQRQYRTGEIKEEDLTMEQVISLCKLYDKQIEELRKINQIKRQKLLRYKKV